MDIDFISDYEPFDNVFDLVFLNRFFNKETENNTEDKIERDSLVASNNTLDAVIHFDVNQPLQHDPKDEGARWIKRRRFKKGTEEYILWRREIKLKNRISARKSIEKKQAYIQELEAKVLKLKTEIKLRKKVEQIFPNSKPASRLFGLRRVLSTSDFYFPTQVAAEEANTSHGTSGHIPSITEYVSNISSK